MVTPVTMVKRISLIIIMCLLVGCQKNDRAKKREHHRYFLISHAGAGDPFWNIVFKGAREAQSNLGVEVQILAPEIPNDVARQVELLNAAIAAKPKGIALSIPDDRAFSASLKEAQREGIPIIAYNTRPNEQARDFNPFLAFIGMNDIVAGRKLAERFYQSGKLKNHVAVAMYQAGHVGLERRYLGIYEELSRHGIQVDKLEISSDATQAQQILASYIKKNPHVSALFFVGSFGVHAVARWLRDVNPAILMASFDLTPLTIELIKNQTVSYSIDQQPFMQGYMAIAQLNLHARFALHPADLDTGIAIIDIEKATALADLVKSGVR